MLIPTTPDIVSLQPMLQKAHDLGDANYRALIAIVNKALGTVNRHHISATLLCVSTFDIVI